MPSNNTHRVQQRLHRPTAPILYDSVYIVRQRLWPFRLARGSRVIRDHRPDVSRVYMLTTQPYPLSRADRLRTWTLLWLLREYFNLTDRDVIQSSRITVELLWGSTIFR